MNHIGNAAVQATDPSLEVEHATDVDYQTYRMLCRHEVPEHSLVSSSTIHFPTPFTHIHTTDKLANRHNDSIGHGAADHGRRPARKVAAIQASEVNIESNLDKWLKGIPR